MQQLPKVLALAALLSLAACAPSPEQLCDHVIELSESEDEDAASIDRDDCIDTAERKKQLHGMLKYKQEARCIMDAETRAELGKCGSPSAD